MLVILVILASDKAALVFEKGHSKQPMIDSRVRQAFVLAARFSVSFLTCNVPGACNLGVDALSRLDLQTFMRGFTGAAAKMAVKEGHAACLLTSRG